MIDQAHELRQRFAIGGAQEDEERRSLLQTGLGEAKTDLKRPLTGAKPRAKIITVTSGKGGVGKSNFALGLAMALAQLDKKILLIDADMALANLDVLLGFHPRYTLADVVRGQKNLEEIFLPGPAGITLLPASCGAPELAQGGGTECLENLLPRLKTLAQNHDYILIDTAAGLTKIVLDFIIFADQVALMTTPEPTAITDAYAMMKVIGAQPFHPPIGLLVNGVHSQKQAVEIFENLMLVVDRFLKLEIGYLGYILHDEKVPAAVRQQKPLLLAFPDSVAASCINTIARTFLA